MIDSPFEAFFDLVPTGAVLYAPIMDSSGDIVDFRFVRLNPAAQRLLGLPAQPTSTFRELYPHSMPSGIFDQYRTAFLTGHASTYDVPYEGDGINTFFRLVAQRSGELLVVNFTDMADLPYPSMEQSLRERQARAEAERLQQERDTFYQIFAMTPAAICIQRGPEHRYEYANEAYLQFFPGRQILGQTVAEALPETVESGVVGLLDYVYQTGETYYGEELPLLIAQPNGPPKWMYFTFTYQAYREKGEIVGISTFAYNVAEQVLAREQREQQRRQLQAVFAQAPVAICVFRGEDYVLDIVNPPMSQMLGRPLPELVGRPFLEALPELRSQGLHELLAGVRHTGTPYVAQEQEIQLAHHLAGHPGYYNFVYQPLLEADGHMTGIVCVTTDVTEQVRARRRVEANAQQLRLLTDALPVLIGYLDRERRYQFTNEAYRTWFHQDPAALLGRSVREIVGEKAYAATSGYMDRALAGERLDFEATMPYREGFTKYIRTSYVPDVREGEVVGFYTLVNDITEQVLAREQVQEMNEELAALNEELQVSNEELQETNNQLVRTNTDLDTFIYTASHDLKQPITNIESLVRVLGEQLEAVQQVRENPLVTQLLDMLQQTVVRFQTTIAQLTDITKLQLAHTGPAEPVRLATVVEEVRQDLGPALQAAATRLVVEIDSDLIVSFSPANLRSIVYNLLSNAVKYRDPKRFSQVRIHAEQTPQNVVLTVQDNGLGMSELQQRQLFGLFQRLHTHVEGTGVGLYIVKRLVENAGGTIHVHSQPNVGAIFSVTFPR